MPSRMFLLRQLFPLLIFQGLIYLPMESVALSFIFLWVFILIFDNCIFSRGWTIFIIHFVGGKRKHTFLFTVLQKEQFLNCRKLLHVLLFCDLGKTCSVLVASQSRGRLRCILEFWLGTCYCLYIFVFLYIFQVTFICTTSYDDYKSPGRKGRHSEKKF